MNTHTITKDPDCKLYGRAPGLPDEYFSHDGLITKHDIRAISLASLRPLPNQLLWDLGTGAGSIAIEWCRTNPTCTAIGIEKKPKRANHARVNADNLTAPGQFTLIEGSIAELLPTLPQPDAVFVGGGLTSDVAKNCLEALSAGGRFVAHGVTIETDLLLDNLFITFGGNMSRISISHNDAIGSLHGFKPLRTVTAWTWIKS